MCLTMKIYNTMNRRKEEFVPIRDDLVTVYSCGPTVYSYAHIGNMRTYIFMDSFRRVMKYAGYHLKHVMNITDVGHLVSDADDGEDKMEKAAKKLQKTPWEIAAYYTDVFFKDLDRLHVDLPEITPKATEHINQMIAFVQELCDKGYGYETSDGIYFDIEKFPGYGKLSGAKLDDQIAGARVSVNTEKHNPADFALWKKAPKEHIMQWPSPWGMGYPGWHIECSTMSREYLGDVFDIHTGGVDHIPIHHENEIAQSEALLGKPAVHYWMHGEFLLVDNGKMSKSLGNTYTISDLMERGYSPMAYKYFCLNGHYRNKLNFTWDGLAGAQTSLHRLYEALNSHKGQAEAPKAGFVEELKREFDDAVFDDLNMPLAVSVIWKALRSPVKSSAIYDFVCACDAVLGLNLKEDAENYAEEKRRAGDADGIDDGIKALVEERTAAKKNRDFARADAIRNQLKEMGYSLLDTREGVRIIKD